MSYPSPSPYVHKKALNEKKCLRLFNKKTPLYAGLGSKQKRFSKCQATYHKELCLLLENQANFLQSERKDRHDPHSPVRFSLLFIDPAPAQRTYILKDPLWIKLTMGQLLLFFLCNFSSFFSDVGGILLTNYFSLFVVNRYILAIQQIITREEHLRYSF